MSAGPSERGTRGTAVNIPPKATPDGHPTTMGELRVASLGSSSLLPAPARSLEYPGCLSGELEGAPTQRSSKPISNLGY
jgi:hypothetical protein